MKWYCIAMVESSSLSYVKTGSESMNITQMYFTAVLRKKKKKMRQMQSEKSGCMHIVVMVFLLFKRPLNHLLDNKFTIKLFQLSLCPK